MDYSHVLASAISYMTEYLAVSYDFQLGTLFSTVSLDALWFSISALVSGLLRMLPGQNPKTDNFRPSDALACISENLYSRASRGVITLIGILFGMCWIVGCFRMWLDVNLNSSLFRMSRWTSGAIRNILDVAWVVQRYLGGVTRSADLSHMMYRRTTAK